MTLNARTTSALVIWTPQKQKEARVLAFVALKLKKKKRRDFEFFIRAGLVPRLFVFNTLERFTILILIKFDFGEPGVDSSKKFKSTELRQSFGFPFLFSNKTNIPRVSFRISSVGFFKAQFYGRRRRLRIKLTARKFLSSNCVRCRSKPISPVSSVRTHDLNFRWNSSSEMKF